MIMASESEACNVQNDVVQARNEAQDQGTGNPWSIWAGWWSSAAENGWAQQRELQDWMSQMARCATDPECWPRRATALATRLSVDSLATLNLSAHLAVDHHRVGTKLSHDAWRAWQSGSPAEIEALAVRLWPSLTELPRLWGLLPLRAQAKLVDAWAEFFSLPAVETADG